MCWLGEVASCCTPSASGTVAEALDAIQARNDAKYEDPVLEDLARRARETIEQLKQE